MYRKRSSEETDAGTSSTNEDFDKLPRQKRGLSVSTVEKWILDYDKTLNTSTWLGYDKTGRNQVARLKCKVCQRFVDKIRGSRNFSTAFIDGSENLQTTSFKDHAKPTCAKGRWYIWKKNNPKTFVTVLLLPGHFFTWTLKPRQRSRESLTWHT